MSSRTKRRLPVVAPEFPPMKCDDGCGECCGPAPVTELEFNRVVQYVREHKIVPKDQGLTCPLYLGGRCSVYAARPLICRAFGHAEGLDCHRGHNTNIPSEEMAARMRANGEPTHLLHEVLSIINPLLTFQGVLKQMLPDRL